MELTDIDLNQLVLFQQLMNERRVSKVADNLGLTQPAVSNSLARLRRQFGDDLFVRTPAGMMPTPFAQQLAEPVGEALAILHGGLNQHRAFDPASVQMALTIGMTDIGEIVFLPELLDYLSKAAPGLTLSTVRGAPTQLRQDMETGKVDLAIGPLPELKAGFFQRRLFAQRYVCLFRQAHPLAGKRFTLADFKAAEHLLVVSPGTDHGKVDEAIRRAGIERRVRLTVPHFVSLGHILKRTDLIATVTERLAQGLAEPFGLIHRPLPMDVPAVAINLFWHFKVHRSPAHQWLREVIVELFGEAGAARSGRRAA